MTAGTADEMEQYITKMAEEARQPRLECRIVSHKTCVEKMCKSAEGVAKMLHQITEPAPWRAGASL